MRHGLAFFDDTSDDGWGVVWLISLVVAALSVVFFFVTGAMPWLIGPAWLAFFSYGMLGHHFWPLTGDQIEGWKDYQSLPAEHRASINMTRQQFALMTNTQRGEVATKVNDLQQIIKNRNEGLNMPSELRVRFDAVLENERSAYKHEQDVKGTMKELGYDE